MKKRNSLQKVVTGYAFLTPSLMLLLTFMIVPIIMSIYFSFTKYNGLTEPLWVGVRNYQSLFESREIRAALQNTLVFVAVTAPAQISISLIIAAVLAARYRNRFGSFVRGCMFIPVLCSASIVGSIFCYLFASDEGALFNQLVMALGFPKQNWLGSSSTALYVICFVTIWKNIGYYLVIFYAGIMDIPKTLYEAADIDGASQIQQFFYITLPNLRDVAVMIVTVCIIWSFQLFDITYTMTQGGPGNSTISLVTEIYKEGFSNFKLGSASAIAMLLFIIIAGCTMLQKLLTREKQ